MRVDHQTGGAVSTRGMKRVSEDSKHNVKAAKPDEDVELHDTKEEYSGEPNPLFIANVKKIRPSQTLEEKCGGQSKIYHDLRPTTPR